MQQDLEMYSEFLSGMGKEQEQITLTGKFVMLWHARAEFYLL